MIQNVKTAKWDDRSTVKLGKCLGAQSFWTCENDILSILIGDDDEIWDMGFLMPQTVIEDIISEIERETLQKTN
ncbi:MAG TPA: hypothetical protein PKY59_03950 [Pyrinomonadaceae bacterium]|nr:hypothetical protein [Pyrinomonadaceae bacterium]